MTKKRESYVPGVRWRDCTGKTLLVHRSNDNCQLGCPIHAPSEHTMNKWPLNYRTDRGGLMERMCGHGVGHPDPDHLSYVYRNHGQRAMEVESVHGCDGCCHE